MATDDDIRDRLMADGFDFGVSATEEETLRGVPAGVGAYMLGFLNGLILAQEAPAVAAEVTQVFVGDVNSRATSSNLRGKVSANQQHWIEGWRETVG